MAKQPRYTAKHAQAGLSAKFPEIETWPNQFPGYEIVVDDSRMAIHQLTDLRSSLMRLLFPKIRHSSPPLLARK